MTGASRARGAPLAKRAARLRVALSLAAAGLSYGWWRVVLGGAPKIIDATSYGLQARALARGALTWALPGPTASFAGRFLMVGAHGRVGGIFPSGWPALLSVGYALGAPWLPGCALAALIAWMSGSLASSMASDEATRTRAAVIATAVSTLSATLRFHTAETMSHGLAAALFLGAMLAAMRARSPSHFALSGACVGALVTVRPVSAMAVSLVCAAMAWREGRWRAVSAFALGAAPGVALHALAQHAVTGRWGEATQTAYYATRDGPRGCFRYGFGARIGCRVEHGDFVSRYVPHGYGAREALWVTLRRLRAHLRDVANFEALSLALVSALMVARSNRRVALGAAATLALLIAYAPFYFDGNIDGGGARMLVDALPIEHAMIAVALAAWRPRAASLYVVAMVVCGALWGASGHRAVMAMTDHGVRLVRAAGLTRGLLLVDDDHAFATLHDPFANARDGLMVARSRGDATDRVVYERAGRPPTWRLRVTRGRGDLSRWAPTEGEWRFRGASLWPADEQRKGWIRPRGDGALDVVGDCCVEVRVAIAAPRRGAWCARVEYEEGPAVERCEEASDAVRVTLTRAGVVRSALLTAR